MHVIILCISEKRLHGAAQLSGVAINIAWAMLQRNMIFLTWAKAKTPHFRRGKRPGRARRGTYALWEKVFDYWLDQGAESFFEHGGYADPRQPSNRVIMLP
jgi:hypothetical protein